MQVHFDYDGVLVDSLEILHQLFVRTWKELGVGREPLLRDLTHTPTLTFPFVARQMEIPVHRQDDYLARICRLQATDERLPPLFPGISRLLQQLSRHHQLTVVSASSRAAIERTLAVHGVGSCFDRICGAEDGDDKAAVIRMLKRESREPGGPSILIGDTVGDIRQGRVAGALTVAVTWGYQDRERLMTERPDFLVHSPRDIASLVAEVSRRPRPESASGIRMQSPD